MRLQRLGAPRLGNLSNYCKELSMRKFLIVGLWVSFAYGLAWSGEQSEIRWVSTASAKPHAPRKKKLRKKKRKGKQEGLRRCISFSQNLGEDQASVDFRLTSRCKQEATCTLEWQVACSPGEEGEVQSHSTTILAGEYWEKNASANHCESEWSIRKVKWTCSGE